MDKRTYSEKLKDPRWQKKRLEILERDNWTCVFCGNNEQTLNVHHIFYIPGCEPWEIPNGLLVTLCEDCHKPGPCAPHKSCEECPSHGECDGYADPPNEFISEISQFMDMVWCRANRHGLHWSAPIGWAKHEITDHFDKQCIRNQRDK